jgi:protein-tyrosine phosphatase
MQITIFWIDNSQTRRLAILPRPRSGDWLEDEIKSLRNVGVDMLASLLTREEVRELGLVDEARYCAAVGIEFVSFPFTDRGVPASVPDTLALVRRLAGLVAEGRAVAIHCRQGVGRSALIAACVLVALGEKPEVALERVAKARGRPVPDTPEQRDWVVSFAEQHHLTRLLLSTRSLPSAQALAEAARRDGWTVHAWDEKPPDLSGHIVYYGGSDVAIEVAKHYRLALLEPPLDLLCRLPAPLLQRRVEYTRFRDLVRLRKPAFVKPADPLDKCFDAGTYADAASIRVANAIDLETPVLVADPVEWLAEFRCFVCEGRVVASSPYLSFGRPVWRAWGQGGEKAVPSQAALAVCERLLTTGLALPPAFVVDVGLIEDRGWAVVEFNPAWCSGVLGADPKAVLHAVQRSCREATCLGEDVTWVVQRASTLLRRRAGR